MRLSDSVSCKKLQKWTVIYDKLNWLHQKCKDSKRSPWNLFPWWESHSKPLIWMWKNFVPFGKLKDVLLKKWNQLILLLFLICMQYRRFAKRQKVWKNPWNLRLFMMTGINILMYHRQWNSCHDKHHADMIIKAHLGHDNTRSRLCHCKS